MLRFPLRLTLAALLLPLGGCATAATHTINGSSPHKAVVEVRNDRWEDLTVYLEREGSEMRLGVVPGKNEARLTVPEEYLRLNCWLRLVARTTGRESRAFSQVFGLDAGSHVFWAIPLTNGESPVTVQMPPA